MKVVAITWPLPVEQIDLHAGQHDVVRADDAIAFRIQVHAAFDARGRMFAEVVVGAVIVGHQHDIRKRIGFIAMLPPSEPTIAAVVEVSAAADGSARCSAGIAGR